MMNTQLVIQVEALRRQHVWCDDCWYSCPKSEDGCCNDNYSPDECTCGADDHNARVDTLIAALTEDPS